MNHHLYTILLHGKQFWFTFHCCSLRCGTWPSLFFLFSFAYFYSPISVVLWGLGCSHCVFPVFHREEVLVRPRLRLSRLCEVKNDLLPHFPLPCSPLQYLGALQHNKEQMFRKLFAGNNESRLELFPPEHHQ